jgi:hypothetical protein
MGRNALQVYQGKTLGEWQEQIRLHCDSGPQRRCKQNDTLTVLHSQLRRNFACFKARMAVQKFYTEVDQRHADENSKLMKTLLDCLRFLKERLSGTLKRARKEQSRREHERRQAANALKKPRPLIGKPVKVIGKLIKSLPVLDQPGPSDAEIEAMGDLELATLVRDLSRDLIEVGQYEVS